MEGMETNVEQLQGHCSTWVETAGIPGRIVSPLHQCRCIKDFNAFQFDSPDDKNDDEFTMNSSSWIVEFTTRRTEWNLWKEHIPLQNTTTRKQQHWCYVTALRTLVKTCNTCDCMHDSIIRDRIVLGIQDHSTRKRLLQERSLTLAKCIDLCKSSEATNLQMKTISGAQNEDIYIVKDKNPPSSRRDDKFRKSLGGGGGNRRNANFVEKFILSKKASVPPGEQNVQSAVAEIISKQPAQFQLEKCTALGMNPPMTAM